MLIIKPSACNFGRHFRFGVIRPCSPRSLHSTIIMYVVAPGGVTFHYNNVCCSPRRVTFHCYNVSCSPRRVTFHFYNVCCSPLMVTFHYNNVCCSPRMVTLRYYGVCFSSRRVTFHYYNVCCSPRKARTLAAVSQPSAVCCSCVMRLPCRMSATGHWLR